MKRTNPTGGYWTWISFVVFALLIILLGTSLIKKQSPGKLLKSIFTKEVQEEDLSTYPKDVLVQMVKDQKLLVDSLQKKVDRYIDLFGIAMGRINVNTDALNMRSLPTTSSEVILRIPNKTLVKIIAFGENEEFIEGATGRWCFVEYNEQEGWVWGNYVDIVQ